jgi:glycosyltransferase involved in cell wall biosynthesis
LNGLRVAHVVATFPPYWGGTGNVAFHNALELARRGLRVTVLTAAAPTGGWTDPPELAVRRLPTPFRFGNAPFLPLLLGALHRFDLVHLHWPFIFGAELTWLGCRLGGVPYVVTYHHDLRADLRWQFGPYQALVGPRVIGDAGRVLPVSLDHFRASPMFRHAAATRRRIVEIPNGVDVRRFRPDVDGGAVRRARGLPDGAFVVGYLGAMDQAHAFKGVPVLLQAMTRLDGAHLLAVGGGDLQPTYRQQAERLGLGDRAHWTGMVGADELPSHLAAMDVLVLPSLGAGAESFGIVLIEAMASGKPVVASALPGVRRVVDDGRNGLLAPPGDADRLAAALARLSGDPELRRSLGAAGRAKAESQYDWRRIADRLEGEYRAVVGSGG